MKSRYQQVIDLSIAILSEMKPCSLTNIHDDWITVSYEYPTVAEEIAIRTWCKNRFGYNSTFWHNSNLFFVSVPMCNIWDLLDQ